MSSFSDTPFWKDACTRADNTTLHQINNWYRAAHLPGFNRLEDVPVEPTAADYVRPRPGITRKTRAIVTRVNKARAHQHQPLIDLEDDDMAVAALLLARYKARLNKARRALARSYQEYI